MLAHFHVEHQRTPLLARFPSSNSENASSRPRAKSSRIIEFRFSNSEPPGVCGSTLEPPSHLQNRIGVPETLRVLGRLIGTPGRLETRVSHRKQTLAAPSNRYTSHPVNALPFALSHRREASASHQSLLTSHHSPVSTRDSQTSRIARKSLKTNGRVPVYPRRFLTRHARSLAVNFSPEGQQSATISASES